MNSIAQFIQKNAAKSYFQINIKELNNIGKKVLSFEKDLSNPTYSDEKYVLRKN
jgi:hypothetical protein